MPAFRYQIGMPYATDTAMENAYRQLEFRVDAEKGKNVNRVIF